MSHLEPGVLQEWLDGELTGEALAAAEAHLAGCAACGAALDEMRATMSAADGLVARLEYVPAPGQRGAPSHGGTPGKALRRFRLSVGQMGMAAGLLVAVTAGLVLRQRGSMTQSLDQAPVMERAEKAEKAERAEGAEAPAAGKADAPVTADKAAVETPAPPAAGAPIENTAAAAPRPVQPSAQRLEHSVVLRPRRIGILVPVRLDTLPGAFRSTYDIGGTAVVLEESVRPLPAMPEPANAAVRQDSNARAVYDWLLHGAYLRLSGALGQDSLAALSRLVR